MKHIFSCFLFQTRPEDGCSKRRRTVFWLWNALLLAGSAAVLGLLSLTLAPGPYGWELFFDYFRRPALVALNLLPPVVLAVLLYGIAGRTWLAFLLTALPVLGLSFGNYYKLAFRDDPVIASDLLILGEAGQMAGKYQLFLSSKMAACLACTAVLLALLALLARENPSGVFARSPPPGRWPRGWRSSRSMEATAYTQPTPAPATSTSGPALSNMSPAGCSIPSSTASRTLCPANPKAILSGKPLSFSPITKARTSRRTKR